MHRRTALLALLATVFALLPPSSRGAAGPPAAACAPGDRCAGDFVLGPPTPFGSPLGITKERDERSVQRDAHGFGELTSRDRPGVEGRRPSPHIDRSPVHLVAAQSAGLRAPPAA